MPQEGILFGSKNFNNMWKQQKGAVEMGKKMDNNGMRRNEVWTGSECSLRRT